MVRKLAAGAKGIRTHGPTVNGTDVPGLHPDHRRERGLPEEVQLYSNEGASGGGLYRAERRKRIDLCCAANRMRRARQSG